MLISTRRVGLKARSNAFSNAKPSVRRPSPLSLGRQAKRATVVSRVAEKSDLEEAKKAMLAETPGFDLQMAVSMAGYTFFTYMEPYLPAPGFHDMSPDGTETVFTDTDFIRDQFEGILYVELISASSLTAADLNGLSDPYVVITCGGSAAKSKVIDATLNPEWDQKFFFYVTDAMNGVIKFDVFDKDLLSSDDELGYVIVPLAEFEDEQVHHLDLKLLGADAGKGRLDVRVTYVKMENIPEEVLDIMTAKERGNPSEAGPRPREAPYLIERVVDQHLQKFDCGVLGSIYQTEMEKRQATLAEVGRILSNPPEVPPLEASDWPGLAEMAGKDQWAHGSPVCFVENHESDTQVWIYANKETRECVVAFRGTEQSKFQDVLSDLNVAMCNLEDGSLDENRFLPLTFRVIKALTARTDQVNVHHGFYIATLSMEPTLQYWVDRICGFGEKGRWRIYSTGHSLGGALATMFAFRLMTRKGRAAGMHDIIHYTYGAPRVGNKAFVETFDRLVKDSWRITNKDDVIPLTPRLLGYGHVRSNAMITAEGKLVLQADRGGKDVFGDGGNLIDIARDFFETVVSQDPDMVKRWELIVEDEKDLFETMKNGTAFLYHLEPAYMESLQSITLENAQKLAKDVEKLSALLEARSEDDVLALAEYA